MSTILVADDRETNRDVLRTLLGYQGHKIVEARDGREALELARQEMPDLIISDILMPTMDGFEFVSLLREDERVGATPVIFNTAHYLEREAAALAERVGVRHIIYKPADPQTILATVADALRRKEDIDVKIDHQEQSAAHLQLITDKLAKNVEFLRASIGKLRAFGDLTVSLGATRDPIALIESLCESTRSITGARLAAAGILDGPSGRHRHIFVCGQHKSTVAMIDQLPPDEILASVVRDGKLIRLPAANSSQPDVQLRCNFPFYEDVGSLIAVPIESMNKRYGWLCLAGKVGLDAFSHDDEELTGNLAALVGRLYENEDLRIQTQEQVRTLAAEISERQRIETERAAIEAQLRHAQKLESLGTLAGGIAHDINNLLLPITSLINMVIRALPEGSAERDQAELIKSAATRMRNLVRQILAFARQEDAEMCRTDLTEVLSGAVKLLRSTMPEVELESSLPENAAHILGNSDQLQQTVINLAVNAADATKGRHGKIGLSLQEVTLGESRVLANGALPAGAYWCVRVSDNGAGMDVAQLQRIFEPFFTTKGAGKGTGLGLSIVHSIVTGHSGGVSVESTLGSGTTFTLYFPKWKT